jgi:hypothetical protein
MSWAAAVLHDLSRVIDTHWESQAEDSGLLVTPRVSSWKRHRKDLRTHHTTGTRGRRISTNRSLQIIICLASNPPPFRNNGQSNSTNRVRSN